MPLANLLFLPMLLVPAAPFSAANVDPAPEPAPTAPNQPTYGLPACTGTYTGLTERYELRTLYVDDCLDGNVIEEDLPIIDLTSSVVVIQTSRGRVTVHLPE